MGLKPPLNAQFPKGKYAASSVEIMTKAPATWTIHSDRSGKASEKLCAGPHQ